jgi:membrane protein implicated in regulation of membrane protease activity
LDKKSSLRRGAILWFIASALSLTAAMLTFSGEGRINWALLAATVFMAAIGFRSLRRSKSDGR